MRAYVNFLTTVRFLNKRSVNEGIFYTLKERFQGVNRRGRERIKEKRARMRRNGKKDGEKQSVKALFSNVQGNTGVH